MDISEHKALCNYLQNTLENSQVEPRKPELLEYQKYPQDIYAHTFELSYLRTMRVHLDTSRYICELMDLRNIFVKLDTISHNVESSYQHKWLLDIA